MCNGRWRLGENNEGKNLLELTWVTRMMTMMMKGCGGLAKAEETSSWLTALALFKWTQHPPPPTWIIGKMGLSLSLPLFITSSLPQFFWRRLCMVVDLAQLQYCKDYAVFFALLSYSIVGNRGGFRGGGGGREADAPPPPQGFDPLPTQRVPPLILFLKSIFGRPTLKFF